MRTRRGNSYPIVGAPTTKRRRFSSALCNFFDILSDDVVLAILIKLAISAESPADFVVALLACKRFNCLGLNPLVLKQASVETFAVKPGRFSIARWFLQRCADAGNAEANYTMGMVQFYCFHNHRLGASLMAKAAIRSHAQALYSLAIIQFNGSGGAKSMRDLPAGVTLCARAAFLGHVDAIRELGHCLKDGYGVTKNVEEGQRFLLEANTRELAAICSTPTPGLLPAGVRLNLRSILRAGNRSSGYRFSLPPPKCHPANRFMVGWYKHQVANNTVYRNCSYGGCGRLETMVHEFRRCSVCGLRNYCSRGCQSRDWTLGHNRNCRPMVRFPIINAGAAEI